MAFRLTHLSMDHRGDLQAKPLDDEVSALRKALWAWEAALPFAGQKDQWTWSGTDPAMAAALFKGAALDFLAEHGPLGVVKACQMTAGYVAQLDPPQAHLQASWPDSRSSASMYISFKNPLKSMGNEMEGTGFSEKEISPLELAQAVEEELVDGGPQPRFVLDPLTMVPDERFLALAMDLEKTFPNDAFAQVFAAAAVLLAWQSCEQIHGETFAVTIGGLTRNGLPVHPGLEACAEATVQLMDVALRGPTVEPEPSEVGFTVRRPRLS